MRWLSTVLLLLILQLGYGQVKSDRFLDLLLYSDREHQSRLLDSIASNWMAGDGFMVVDLLRLSNDRWLYNKLVALLSKKGVERIDDYETALQWSWRQPPDFPVGYADFKAALYEFLDPVFARYFHGRQDQSRIRLDEVVWGGVRQDGIPPLRNPKMIIAKEADYLADDHMVFGIRINGEAKAYPQRILAWHEFFDDMIGGERIAGVYCTLCGTVIAYNCKVGAKTYNLGTSGFLYRSNKLMYDRETQSLWNTIEGKPVIGPLIDSAVQLSLHPVVTTTWGDWKALHPDTKVLSIETGHQRDYAEGAAYRSYYATDELMFPVPEQDFRLANKARVLAVRAPGFEVDPLAISVDRLKRRNLHHDRISDTEIVVISDRSGAARAYRSAGLEFTRRKGMLSDQDGHKWEVTEDALIDSQGRRLDRIPSHESFWFAWHGMYPETRLVK